jgi:hypothetical protein
MQANKRQKVMVVPIVAPIIQTQKPKPINMVKQDVTLDVQSDENRCIECGIDMGECNPRQYCGKTYCYQSYS